jgi:hypothetical protein
MCVGSRCISRVRRDRSSSMMAVMGRGSARVAWSVARAGSVRLATRASQVCTSGVKASRCAVRVRRVIAASFAIVRSRSRAHRENAHDVNIQRIIAVCPSPSASAANPKPYPLIYALLRVLRNQRHANPRRQAAKKVFKSPQFPQQQHRNRVNSLTNMKWMWAKRINRIRRQYLRFRRGSWRHG